MILEDVYADGNVDRNIRVLYRLLAERTPEEAISHKRMPDYDEHEMFVYLHPYDKWYLIKVDDNYVGSIYLTDRDEIGIFIFRAFHGNGYGPKAIKALMEKHPRERYLANINPQNYRSQIMFSKLGFKCLQETYELRTQ